MPQYGGSPNNLNRPEDIIGVPIGAVISTGITVGTPLGYLLCDGALYTVTQFPQLYNVINVGHGGTLGVNFRVPNYNNRFLRCHDTMDGRVASAGLDFGPRSIQAAGGSATGVGSVESHAIQGHWHQIFVGSRLADHFYSIQPQGAPNTALAPRLENYLSDGVNGTPQVSSETRPVNSQVSYYMRAY